MLRKNPNFNLSRVWQQETNKAKAGIFHFLPILNLQRQAFTHMHI